MTKGTEKIKVRVWATDTNNKDDVRSAKIMGDMMNVDCEKYKGIINAILIARHTIEQTYAIDTGDRLWDRIMEEVVRYDINETLKLNEK